MSSRCFVASISAPRPPAPVEPLEGHGFEATIDGTTITIPGYGAFFGVIGLG